jgi:dihydrolipoamide dehydrogenase
VTGLTNGIEFLLKKNKVDYFKGKGTFKGPNEISIALNDGGEQTITTDKVCARDPRFLCR